MANTIALEPQACARVEHNAASSRMPYPAPPNSRGIGAESSFAFCRASMVSRGNRAFASTSAAFAAATSVAIALSAARWALNSGEWLVIASDPIPRFVRSYEVRLYVTPVAFRG